MEALSSMEKTLESKVKGMQCLSHVSKNHSSPDAATIRANQN